MVDPNFLEAKAGQLAEFYAKASGADPELLLPLARTFVQLEAMHARAEHEANHDALTGLLNRGATDRRLTEAKARTRRHGVPLAVLLIDLDHFKLVNDQHGHAAGDHVLKATARLIKSALRQTDAAGRYGGEEFLVVAESDEPEVLAERIRQSIANHTFVKAPEVWSVTCSVGIATWTPGGHDAGLVTRADAALYQAKDAGRNCVRTG